MVLTALFSPATAQGRFLNLGGDIQLTYDYSKSSTAGRSTTNNSFGQRYTLGASNPIFRFGIFRADASWYSQKLHTVSGQGQPNALNQTRRLRVRDFRLMSALFPRSSPLSLAYQQIDRTNRIDTSTNDTVRTFSAHWVNHFRGFPRLSLNYNRSNLNSETGGRKTVDNTNQSISVLSEGTIKNTDFSAGYQYSESHTRLGDSTTSQGINLSANSRLSEGLTGTALAHYTTSKVPATFVVPGTQFFQERSASVSLYYRPLLTKWDASGSYAYSENPFIGGFKSHALSTNVNLRPYRSFSASGSGRAIRLSIARSSVNTENIAASVSYRPFFGFSTGAGTSFTHSLASSANNPDNVALSESVNYHVRYNRTVRNLRYNTGYGVSYTNSQRNTSRDSWSLNNTFSGGLHNVDTRFVALGSTLQVTDQRSAAGDSRLRATSVNLNLNARTDYFRNLLRRGDHLSLKGTFTISEHHGSGLEGLRETFESSASYTWYRIFSSVTYTIENYPNSARLDRQSVTSLVQYTVNFIRGMDMTLQAKDSYEDNRYRPDSNIAQGTVDMGYRIGLVSLHVTYIRSMSWYYSDTTIKTVLDSVSATLSRPF